MISIIQSCFHIATYLYNYGKQKNAASYHCLNTWIKVMLQSIIINLMFMQHYMYSKHFSISHMCVCVCVCVCVCAYVSPPPRLLITSGMIWCDMEPL